MADEQNKGGSTSFGRRLGEIAWGGFKDSVGSQLSSLSDIKSDADTFKSQVMQDVNDAIGTFNKFKNGSKSPMKKVRDWFYSNDMMTGGFGFDNDSDDFDAGFKIDSAGQPQDAEAPRTLDAESMNDIAKKQTGEAYKIAAKQADLQMANTAEIVSTINSRSAELAASVNKLNETLLGISKKLDNMTGVMVEKAKEEEKFRITNYDGSLSLAGVLGGAYGAKKEEASGYLDMAKMFLGQMTPQYLARMGFDKIFEHEFKALGDKSIAHYTEKLNNAIEDTVQTGLTKFIKGDFLNDFLGINLGSHKREDYQRYATNQYNTKPATFDGMTRMTIVSVIPEYLKSIEAALTGGPAKTVDERGRLTTKSVNHFQNAIGGAVLSGSSDAIKDASTLAKNINSSVSGKKFSTSEVRLVLDAVKIGFLIQMEVYNSKHASVRGNGIVDPDELIWGSDSPRLATAIDYAIEMLSSSDIGNGRNVDDITNAINWIMSTMTSKERRAFAQEITAAGEKITKTGMNFAQTSPFAHQASKVTQNMLQGILHNKITSRLNPSSDTNETTNAAPTDHTSNPNVPGNRNIQGNANQGLIDQVSSGFSLMGMITETQTDILQAQMRHLSKPLFSIANMLRKGINVFVTGQDNSQSKPYTHTLDMDQQQFGGGDFKTSLNRHMRRDNKNNVNPWNMMMNHLRSKNNSSDDNATPNVESNVGGSNTSGGTTSNTDQARSIVSSAANVNVDTDSKEQILEAANDLKEARKDNPNATSGDPEKDKALLKAAEAIEKGEDPKKAMKEAAKSTTEKMKTAAGVVSEGASEVYNIIKDTQVGKFISKHFDENSKVYKIFHSEEAQNVKNEGAKLIDSIFENVGGKVDKAKEAASSKVEALGDKVFNRNKAEQKFAGTDEEKEVLDMYNQQGTEKMMKNLNKRMTLSNSLIGKDLKSDNEQAKHEAEEDQQTMQQLQMYMNSAGVDGSFSKKDIADVRTLINQIHNKKAKANMARYFIPMMMKNSPGSAMENVEPSADGKVSKKNKSLIGSMLGGIAKYAGLIFKPITKILGSGLKVLLGISGLIFKLSGKIIKSGLQDVKYGAKSLAGGIFGSKKQGEESMGMLKRGITLPSRINQAIGAATGISFTKLTDKLGTFIAKTFTTMVDKVGQLGKTLAGWVTNIGAKVKSGLAALGKTRVGKGVKAFFGNAGSKIIDGSDFLKGFTSARREKKAANTERLSNMKATTKAEAEAEKTNTFLGAIKDLVAKIFDQTAEGQKEAKDAREKEEKEKAKANEPKKSLKERAKDKWNSIKERSASLKEQISQDGGRVSLKDALHGAGFGRAKNTMGKGSLGLDLGKMLGGITNILGGIGKVILGAVMGLSGFKALMNTVTKILSSSLTPLNKAFQKITKVLKPVLKTIGNAISSIAKIVSDIGIGIVEVLQPILTDLIQPLFEDLGPMLTDIWDILGKTLMPILKVILKVVLVPLLLHITQIVGMVSFAAAGIQIISGILEGIFGAVLSVVGFFTGNKGTKDKGADMMGAAGGLIKQGFNDMAESAKSIFSGVTKFFANDTTQEEDTGLKRYETPQYIEHGSILDGTYGSGDTYNYYGQVGDINTNSLKNIYGSATSQGSYGNYLGMNKHGCGPMALADVVARRTGANVSSTGLASSMSRSGMYNPNRGTSVANYINAAGSMGVGLTPGGVTSRSLSRATPNNPVTLVGSGNGFGTRNGNTHYVNVLGTKGGMAYVSNPMTGHVERRSVNDLVSRSALGLYGSGDDDGSGDNTYYSFPEAVQDAMKYLKNLAGSLLKMFTGDTVEEEVEKQISEQSQNTTLAEAKKMLGDDYQACEDAAREAAYADYAAQHPKLDSETDEEYQKKQEAYFQKNIVKYLARQDVFNKAAAKNGDVWANILNMHDDAVTSVKNTSGDWASATSTAGNSPTAEKWISTAEGDVGKSRSEVNCSGDHDWCANYISELFKRTGYTGAYNRTVGYLLQELKGKSDEWVESTKSPARGDILFFDWQNPNPFDGSDPIAMQDPNRRWDHVAIVKDVKDGNILYVDGNGGGCQYVKERSIPTSDDDVDTTMRYMKDRTITGSGSGSLPGSTNRDKVWNYLVAPTSIGGLGLSRAGAAGVLGNMLTESHFEPRREEGNYPDPIENTKYNDAVDAGTISKDTFTTDEVGFGLVQWTTSDHKGPMYNNLKTEHDLSIGDMRGQLDFLNLELTSNTPANFSNMLKNLRRDDISVYDATYAFLSDFENPGNKEYNARIRSADAQDIYDAYLNTPIPTSLTIESAESAYEKNLGSIGTGSGSVIITNSIQPVTFNSAADEEHYKNSYQIIKSGDRVTLKYDAARYTEGGSRVDLSKNEKLFKEAYKVIKIYQDEKTGFELLDLEGLTTKNKITRVPRRCLVYAGTVGSTTSKTSTTISAADMDYSHVTSDSGFNTYLGEAARWNSDSYDVDYFNRILSGGQDHTQTAFFKNTYKQYYGRDYTASPTIKNHGTTIPAATQSRYTDNWGTGSRSNSNIYNASANDAITGPIMNSAGVSRSDRNISYADLARLKGNGDWGIESFVGSGDDIPPINADNAFWTEMGFGDGTNKPTQVNTYNIVRTNDAEADKRINAVLKHTFEVKSQSIEAKLDIIIGMMSSIGRSWADTYNGSSQTANTKLFDEYIPSQVSKLSVG